MKFVTTEHSTHNRRRDKRYFKVLDKYIYSKYDAIVSITEKTQKNLIEWISPQEELLKKFVIIENGVNLEKIYNAIPYNKEEINRDFKENDVLICMVGRFAEAKDQPTLIRAISKLPSNIHLILIGEGPLLKNNIQLANQLGVIDRVHFLGFRTDVDRILKSVDIVVLSSFWEGLSLSSIEGLASGKPFIASKVPGLEEIVSDYGLLFTQGDEEEFCSLVKKLIADKEFYYNKAKLCTLRAKEFDIKTMVERLKNLYDNLINNTL